MSRYEWEHGEFVIPAAEWAGLKKMVRNAYNREREALQRYAKELHAEAKATKGPSVGNRIFTAFDVILGRAGRFCASDAERHLLTAQCMLEEQGKLVAPTQARIDRYMPKATNKTTHFDVEEGGIAFNNAKRVVIWSVPRNNHACEKAREHPVGSALFRALARVAWTRKTGGSVIGNDEGNEHCSDLGGGGNYLKDGFGPRHQQAWEKSVGF